MRGDKRDDNAENDHWRALLQRFGLGTLQLPTEGRLAGPWKEFLEQLESEELKRQKTRKERR